MPLSKQENIEDYEVYNGRMDKSVMDKLFFVDKVREPDLLVDFGCAKGSLLKLINRWFSEIDFLGFDKDERMLEKARKLTQENESISFTSDWEEILKKSNSSTSVLLLSSVIHEVYHYSDVDQIDRFWSRVWDSHFDYIVMRDMVPSKSIDRKPPKEKVRKVYSKFGGTKELEDFENIWGSVDTSYKQLVHFLLKYRYVEPSWDREVKENYFPFYIEDLYREIPDEYSILFHHHYVLPYIKQKVREDFDIDLEDPTHFKLILEK